VLWEDPQRLAEASLEDCRMLLASHLRADRFTEGHLLHAFESGHIVRILERVEWLIDGARGDSYASGDVRDNIAARVRRSRHWLELSAEACRDRS
jgi:hypothetical protein